MLDLYNVDKFANFVDKFSDITIKVSLVYIPVLIIAVIYDLVS